MPKYYCDVCDCSIPNNLSDRKKHNQGYVHINNKRCHYDWFKDPRDFIQEQKKKMPCIRYKTKGTCEYKLDCKYSHITWDKAGKPIFPPELNEWLNAKYEVEKTQNENQKQQLYQKIKVNHQYQIPQDWKRQELPLSLQPLPLSSTYDWNNVGTWG